MVVVPAGTYLIGANDGQPNARPAHQVRLDSFAIAKTEVTVGRYKAFATSRGMPVPWGSQEPDSLLPVTGVNFADAQAFCGARYPGGRLPTEEQWEAAARGREGFRFPWGNVLDPAGANTASQRQNRPVTVGSFPRGATPSGVLDLIGNVWEWTASSMRGYPGGANLPDSLLRFRVIRGGAFNTPDTIATASVRGYLPPAGERYTQTGFRCVMPVQGARPPA
jgi:iron(II)-dependent oxidoreductase